ncbi:MAG: copper transporter [Actinomycetota bacterium]|nr:copper transporter [Actinomycetota bacterium]
MISLRYHVISIGAVFLALALGVVLGSTALSDRLLSGVSADRTRLEQHVTDLQEDNDALRARLVDAAAFAAVIGPRVVRETLQGRTIVLVTTSDANPVDRDGLIALLRSAGATVTGEVQLTDAFTDPARSDQLIELTTRLLPAGTQLPTAPDVGTLTGGLLGSLLLLDPTTGAASASPDQTATVLAGFGDGGFLQAGPRVQPAQLAVVLTGPAAAGHGSGDRAGILARFATQLDRSSAGVVLAGPPGSAHPSGALGVVRADTAATSVLSTVDGVDSPSGQIATVLALAEQAEGRAGRYGTAGNADAVVPALAR